MVKNIPSWSNDCFNLLMWEVWKTQNEHCYHKNNQSTRTRNSGSNYDLFSIMSCKQNMRLGEAGFNSV